MATTPGGPLAIGELFEGRFRVEQQLASSPWSALYRVRLEPDGYEAALRVLPLSDGHDYLARERLRNDLRLAMGLRHPSLAAVYESGESAPGAWVVSEWLLGRSLLGMLAERGGAPPAVAAQILGQLLTALSEAHAVGLVHHDVRPANVFVPGFDAVDGLKLTDLGVAPPVPADALPPALAARGVPVLGTAGYLAPEVLAGELGGMHADLYAAGLVALEVLTGRPAFPGATPAARIQAQLAGPPAVPPHVAATPLFQRVLAGLLAVDPGERYISADQALGDLFALANATELGADEPTPPDGVAIPVTRVTPSVPAAAPAPASRPASAAQPSVAAPRRGGRGPVIAIGVALALVVVAGVAVLTWFLLRDGDDEGEADASASAEEGAESGDEGTAPGDGAGAAASDDGDDSDEGAGAGEPAGEDPADPLAELEAFEDSAPPLDASPDTAPPASDDPSNPRDPSAGSADAQQTDPGPQEQASAGAPTDPALATGPAPDGSVPTDPGLAPDGAPTVAVTAAETGPVQRATPRPVEAGDPLYSSCQAADRLERCFTLVLEPGRTVELDPAALAPTLTLVEREHPFAVQVVDGRVQLSVSPHYLFARFELSDASGERFTVLAYSERAVTRKAMALYERSVAEHVVAVLGEEAAASAPPVVPFYGERAELSGDSLDEVVVQGVQQSGPRAQRLGFSMIAGPDAGRSIDVRSAVWPSFGVWRLRQADGSAPRPMLAFGQLGCEAPAGLLVLWRLGAGDAPEMFIDTRVLGGADSRIPEAIREAGDALRVVVVISDDALRTVERVELYPSAAACQAGSDGTTLSW